MAFWRRTREILFGEPGPADTVVTREEDSLRLRLPNQRHNRPITSVCMTIAMVLGPVIIVATILDGDPPNAFLIVGVALAMLTVAYLWRVVWHHELVLKEDSLRVACSATLVRASAVQVDMREIRQFTIVRNGLRCVLQAESATGPPQVFYRNQDGDKLHALAVLLADQYALLAPGRGRLRVAVEVPHLVTNADRVEQPLNSQVGVRHPETGITLEIPLPEDTRLQNRRSAWHLFEVGILILVGAVIWFAVCSVADWPDARGVANVMFIFGILALISASSKSWSAWTDNRQDDDLRQLSVVGNMLIRTSRDHRKKAWYRAEIKAIHAVVVQCVTNTGESGNTEVSYHLDLMLELSNGEKTTLLGPIAYHPAIDYRPKAECEWIATKLRQALFGKTEIPEAVGSANVPTDAIQEVPAWIKEKRIV